MIGATIETGLAVSEGGEAGVVPSACREGQRREEHGEEHPAGGPLGRVDLERAAGASEPAIPIRTEPKTAAKGPTLRVFWLS